MKLRELIETSIKGKHITSILYNKETYPIFTNPDKKDKNEIAYQGRIRLIVDEKEGKIYAFDPHLIHSKAAEALGFDYSMMGNAKGQYFVVGNYSPSSGKMYVDPNSFKYIGGKLSDWANKAKELSKKEWFNKYIELSK